MADDIADSETRSEAAIALAPQVLEVLQDWKRSGQALSRYSLAARFKTNERIIRQAMLELQLRGHGVIADTDGGYRLARSADEILAYTATLKSRIGALREKVDALDRVAAEMDPEPLQPTLL